MIAFLQGTILDKDTEGVVLKVGGIGYRVFLPANLIASLPPLESELQLHISMEVREDNVALYGFRSKEELELYKKLQSVSGIGPKGALSIIGAADQNRLIRSIINEEVNYLTKLPGVGKKTAQRLILELKDKLKLWEDELPDKTEGGSQAPVLEDALQALLTLGYQKTEVLPILTKGQELLGEKYDTQELIRFVLKGVGKNRRR